MSGEPQSKRVRRGSSGSPPEPKQQRNVLFITADQFRADCLFGDFVKTPNLDLLMACSSSFTKHFTSTAPCSPARASLHTGTYQMTHRVVVNGTPLDDRFTNWAREMRAAGRDPTLFGYTDTGLDPKVCAAPAHKPARTARACACARAFVLTCRGGGGEGAWGVVGGRCLANNTFIFVRVNGLNATFLM